MATPKLTPGDKVRFRTQPGDVARYNFTREDGKLDVTIVGTYVYDAIWPVDGTEFVAPADEQNFGWAIDRNPTYRRWCKQNGRKPTLAEAGQILDERGVLVVEPAAATVAAPVVYECLECGARYEQPGMVEDGGMGCVRCNR